MKLYFQFIIINKIFFVLNVILIFVILSYLILSHIDCSPVVIVDTCLAS